MEEKTRILIVDDERNVVRAVERLFLDDDVEILACTSGTEGLAALRAVSPVQVVVSDYRMPGMNGVDFLREVYRHWPETVRIVLSGYADTAAVVAAINEARIYKFVPKPWDDDELKGTIAGALEKYRRRKRNAQIEEELRRKTEECRRLAEELERAASREAGNRTPAATPGPEGEVKT